MKYLLLLVNMGLSSLYIIYVNFAGGFIGETKIISQNPVDRNYCLDIFNMTTVKGL